MIVVDPLSVPSVGNLQDSEPEEFDFQASSRTSHSEQPVPLGGVPRALREAAEMSGLDPIAELYNEALRYAQEGHLRLARERLQMLLCMAPDDGEARLMLARVHVAGQRWKEALRALDEAQNCGMSVPMNLRRAVEDHLQAEQAADEEQKAALRAREQGEVKALRQEARRLRSDNAQLLGRSADLEREVRKWAWATAGVSGVAILFIAASLIFGGGEAEPAPAVAEAAEAAQEDAGPAEGVEAAEAVPADVATVAGRAAKALEEAPGLDGTALELQVRGGAAVLTGEVLTHAQRRLAEEALGEVEGVDEVDASTVTVLARTRGATHEVQRGDTLSHIAHSYYGDSTLTKPIEEANRGVNSRNLKIGQQLRIPPVR